MTTILEYLSYLELSEKEKKIFNCLLEEDQLSATEIAKRININRSTIYLFLEQLINKGIINQVEKTDKKYYQLSNLQKIEQIIQQKINNLQKFKKDLPEIVKKTKKLKQQKDKSQISILKGKDLMLELLKEISRHSDDVYYLGSVKSFYKFADSSIWGEYNKKRRNDNLPIDFLITDWAKQTIDSYYKDSDTFTKRRWLPKDFEANGGLVVYGDKIAIGILDKDVQIVVIEEPTLAQLFKLAYQALWKDLEGKNIPPKP